MRITSLRFLCGSFALFIGAGTVFGIYNFRSIERNAGPQNNPFLHPTPALARYVAHRTAVDRVAWNAVRFGDLATAQARCEEAARVVGWNGGMRGTLAKRYARAGRWSEAYAAYHIALNPPPGAQSDYEVSSVSWLEFAALCDQMGRTAEAQGAREKAAALRAAARSASPRRVPAPKTRTTAKT